MPSASAIRPLSHATPSHRITPPMSSSLGLTPARALVSTAQRLLRLPLRLWLDRLFPFRSQFLRPRLKHRPHHVGRHQKRKTLMLDVTPAARRLLSIASASGPRWKFRGMLLDIVSLCALLVRFCYLLSVQTAHCPFSPFHSPPTRFALHLYLW